MLYFPDLVWTLVTVTHIVFEIFSFIQVCDAGAGQRKDRFPMFHDSTEIVPDAAFAD